LVQVQIRLAPQCGQQQQYRIQIEIEIKNNNKMTIERFLKQEFKKQNHLCHSAPHMAGVVVPIACKRVISFTLDATAIYNGARLACSFRSLSGATETRPRWNMNNLLETFNTYGWRPSLALSEDENFMDLVLLVTRSSKLKQGSMACILVQPAASENVEPSLALDRIISVSTNQALYKESESDIHAEIAAIGQAAQTARSTKNCTAYITMPPCKRCFAALLSAGVRRIVSRHPSPLTGIAEQHDIEMVYIESLEEQRARVDGIVEAFLGDEAGYTSGDQQ
jgi:dCMP deaminase